MRLSMLPVWSYWAAALVAVVLVALLFVGPTRRKTTRRQRQVLVVLRCAVVLLVVVVMLRPTLVYTSVRRQSATLLLLLDQSRSMQVADAFGNRTRWDALVGALKDSRTELEMLAEDFEVRLYGFAGEPELLDLQVATTEMESEPEGNQTAIGAALEEVLRRESGKRLLGVVLLSDGTQRAHAPLDVPPQLAARRLADLGAPLHTVAVGQSSAREGARDIALIEMQANQTVFVRNQLTVRGNARIDGFVNRDVPVQLLFEISPEEMTVVGSGSLRATSDGQQLPIEMSYVPQVPGEFKVTMRVVEQPGELVTTNNELSTFVTVLKGGLNVLYVEGAIRPEQKFVRRALDASQNIKVDYVRIDAQRPETRPSDLAERMRPGKYDVYILGDVDSQAFGERELEQLRDAVREGAGLIMLGGIHSFGPGGYQRTALADVLPIVMGNFERQNFDEPIQMDLHREGPLAMRPTRVGELHFAMRLGEGSSNAEVWEQLPALAGANRFVELKPGASALAESTAGDPLLVAQDFGAGRVVAFAGDSTWQWVLQGFEDPHRRFWRQLVLWLARKDESSEGEVWVRLQPRRYALGQRVTFSVGAQSETGEAVDDAQFEAVVVRPDGSRRPVRIDRVGTAREGLFLETDSPGDYAVEVAARRGTESLGSARARFLVERRDLELDNPVADPSLLAGLASLTGGEALAPEELPGLFERMREQPPELEIEVLTKHDLWDRWPVLLLLVGLLSCEWWLRKRWGLV